MTEPATSAFDSSGPQLTDQPSFRLLLIEPEAAVQLSVLEAVCAGGSLASVACVSNCAAAHELLRAQPFHALLLTSGVLDAERERSALQDAVLAAARAEVPTLLLGSDETRALARELLGHQGHAELGYEDLTPLGLGRAVASATEQLRAVRVKERLAHHDRLAFLGRSSAGLLHELNNLLTSIVANVALLRDDCDPSGHAGVAANPELGERLEQAWDASTRMVELIRDAGRFTRSSSSTKPLRIEQVLDTALRLAEQRAQAPLVVQRDYGATASVVGDEVQLCQVFVNLLLNAQHALKGQAPGARQDLIAITTRMQSSTCLLVRIRDRGCGIPESHLARVFQPFFSTKSPEEGSGLGLWLCRDMLTRCGGSISVDSSVGRGTTFEVLLPVTRPVDLPGE